MGKRNCIDYQEAIHSLTCTEPNVCIFKLIHYSYAYEIKNRNRISCLNSWPLQLEYSEKTLRERERGTKSPQNFDISNAWTLPQIHVSFITHFIWFLFGIALCFIYIDADQQQVYYFWFADCDFMNIISTEWFVCSD